MRPSTFLPAALAAASTALAQSTVTFVSVVSSTTNGPSTSTTVVSPTTSMTSTGMGTGTGTTTAVVVTQTRSPGDRAAAVEKPVLGLVAACAVGVMVL
ncbi:hypothetical protein QBC39DRAFT_369026 [Podospora conica]|nr:hypothetical protein QBC39DRAFT_369026 [Schizothecium conicum]